MKELTIHERIELDEAANGLREKSRRLCNIYGYGEASIALGEAACLLEQWCNGDEDLMVFPRDAEKKGTEK